MRICILLPSEDAMRQAGVRIRYQRMEPFLAAQGHALRFLDISEALASPVMEDDVYIVSKCYDARAFLALHGARRSGRLIGIDLFDDYFSQEGDSRFMRLRRWLATMLCTVDFVLCSTGVIRDFVARQDPGLPVHVLNDPIDQSGAQTIEERLERKAETDGLEVAWFGMGDNSYFPVGLDDLVAFAGELARLDDGAAEPLRLTVLTNQRALTANSLAGLARLPVDHAVEEWSEAMEGELLARSHVVFLPVNAQNFSTAKSLNRALTALNAGCQVLSVGYPLYGLLDDFIYRSPEELKADRLNGRMRLRRETVPALRERILELADQAVETSRLAAFLDGLSSHEDTAADAGSPAVVFGYESQGDVYNLARQVGALSVKSPFSQSKRKFDMRVDWPKGGGALQVRVEARALGRVVEEWRGLFGEAVEFGEGNYARLFDGGRIPDEILHGAPVIRAADKLGVIGSYEATMRSVMWLADHLFSPGDIYVSEDIRLAVPVPPARHAQTKGHAT